MSPRQRRGRSVLLGVLLLLSLVAIASATPAAGGAATSAERQARPDVVHTVAPHPNSTQSIWPYTSRSRSVESATLPINVVVKADAALVRNVLIMRPDATWTNKSQGLNGSGPPEGGPEGEVVPVSVNATGVHWSAARGADRYTYVRPVGSQDGRWMAETSQLHDGDYFGARYHIRFYEVPDGENTWTALQVHREHFDWFRLRHTVGSLPNAQHYVETQFYGRWYVADLEKHRFSEGGVLNYNGWATVVDLKVPKGVRASLSVAALVLGLAALGSVGRLESPFGRGSIDELTDWSPFGARTLLASLAIAAVPISVRVGSIAVEHAEIVNSPKVVAGTFYPMIALGPPALAYVLFRGVEPSEAFVAAFVALGVGFLADYTYLGIEVLPIQVIVHRTTLLVAVGLLAVAGADRPEGVTVRNPALIAGASVWIVGLLWALFFW